jgi:anti-sigma B factor antagonist
MAPELFRSQQRYEAVDDVAVVHFTGPKVSLDEENLMSIRDQLDAIVAESKQSQLLLDFSNVDYVSSMALGTLVGLHRKLLAAGQRLILCNLTRRVYEVFAVTRLDNFLTLRREEPGHQPSCEDRPAGSSTGVLVVDDEAAVCSVLEAWLRREGFQVWLAAHGGQAIELYRRHQDEIAVVLLDVVMPGMDGPHTLLALQQVSPTVRCCFMTGYPRGYTEETLLLLGAVRVFPKPFAFTEVIDTLNQLVSRSPRHRQDRWIDIPL